MRVIEIGAQIVRNEKIETSATGSVQLLFIDKTTLNIGPNSSVVIDKFVFNPMTDARRDGVEPDQGRLSHRRRSGDAHRRRDDHDAGRHGRHSRRHRLRSAFRQRRGRRRSSAMA